MAKILMYEIKWNKSLTKHEIQIYNHFIVKQSASQS